MRETMPIRITKKLYTYLTKVGYKGETYSDILERLIDVKEKQRQDEKPAKYNAKIS